MGKINYTTLNGVSGNINTLCSTLSSINESANTYPNSVETRLKDYYSSYFSSISTNNTNIENSRTNMLAMGNWFNSMINEGNQIDDANASSTPTPESTNGEGTDQNLSPSDGAENANTESTNGNGTDQNLSPSDGAENANTESTNGEGTDQNLSPSDGAENANTEGTNGEGTDQNLRPSDGAENASSDTTTGAAVTAAGVAGAAASATTTTTSGAGSEASGGAPGSATSAVTTAAGGVGAAAAIGAIGAASGATTSQTSGAGAAQALATSAADALDASKTGGASIESLIAGSALGLGAFYKPVSDPIIFDKYGITPEEWDRLTEEEREAIRLKLKKLGFTDEEIEMIVAGDTKVLSCVQDALKVKLEELLKQDPSLRQKLMDIYGFDIFNEDGTINKTKLTLALLMDDKSSRDNISLIRYLHDVYGIDLVSTERISKVMEKLLKVFEKNPALRELLKKLYGFDIFNDDGTINYENLIKALLMDEVNENDPYNIEKTLDDYNRKVSIIKMLKSYFGGGVLSIFAAATATISGALLIRKIKAALDNKNPIDTLGAYIEDRDYYVISKDELAKITKELDVIEMKLINVSYNYDDIIKFREGKYAVLFKLLDEIQVLLETLSIENPEIKKEITELYGFNIFEGNSISTTKLAILLVIDFKDDKDIYDIVKVLNEKYNANIYIEEQFNKIVKVLKDQDIDEERLKNILEEEYSY